MKLYITWHTEVPPEPEGEPVDGSKYARVTLKKPSASQPEDFDANDDDDHTKTE